MIFSYNFSYNFIVYTFPFMSVTHPKLLHMYSVSKWSKFIFSPQRQAVTSASFIEKNFLSSLKCTEAFVENKRIKYMLVYFWTLYSVIQIYLYPNTTLFNCIGLEEVLKPDSKNTPNFFIFKIILAILSPLNFHLNFKIIFSMYTYIVCWDFDWDYIMSIDQFGHFTRKQIPFDSLSI